MYCEGELSVHHCQDGVIHCLQEKLTELGRLFLREALDSMMTAPCCMMGSNLSTHWLKPQPRISPP